MMEKFKYLMCIAAVLGCQTTKTPEGVRTEETNKSAVLKTNPTAAPTLPDQAMANMVLKYTIMLDELIKTLNKPSEPKIIEQLARALFVLSANLVNAVIEIKPECRGYLVSLLQINDTLLTLSPEAIESGYHRDGKLPKNTSPICHHAKDLMVHPATVVVLNQQSPPVERIVMQREVIELKGHIHEIGALSKANAN